MIGSLPIFVFNISGNFVIFSTPRSISGICRVFGKFQKFPILGFFSIFLNVFRSNCRIFRTISRARFWDINKIHHCQMRSRGLILQKNPLRGAPLRGADRPNGRKEVFIAKGAARSLRLRAANFHFSIVHGIRPPGAYPAVQRELLTKKLCELMRQIATST